MAQSVPLILASASPRRRQLLRKLRRPFRVVPSRASEETSEKNPRRHVVELASRKAMDVAGRILPQALVIGADTVVVLDGKILGKPRDRRHAYQMLYKLSGTTHRVYTGVAVVEAGTRRCVSGAEVSKVRMKRIELDALLGLAGQHLDKAGAYAIQQKHDPIARVIKGSYDNVVGLPLTLVRKLLRAV